MTDSETAAASGVSWEILLLERTLVVHVPLAVVLSSRRLLVGTGEAGSTNPIAEAASGLSLLPQGVVSSPPAAGSSSNQVAKES